MSSLLSIRSGGTSVEAGLMSALHLFGRTEPHKVNSAENARMIILLCDGDGYEDGYEDRYDPGPRLSDVDVFIEVYKNA